MRISYDNLLKTATSLTATYENANYPVTNLYHNWKKKIFEATETSTTISATFDEDSTITSICIANHNLSTCTAKFYNSSSTLLDTWNFDCTSQVDAQYGSVSSVSYVTFSCTSSYDVEIGTLFVGDSVYASIEAEQGLPLSSSDAVSESSDGQVSGRKGSVTRGEVKITIPLLTASERKEIESAFYTCGLITPFFLDLWDSSHAYFEPIYCRFTGMTPNHGKTYDSVKMTIKEVN